MQRSSALKGGKEKTEELMFGQKKKTDSPKYRMEMAKKITGYHVQYVTEHKTTDAPDAYGGVNDDVIGKGGSINMLGDELIVSASGQTVFRCLIAQMDAWELMSGNGVMITAPDLEHGGAVRTITVHYVYYRK